MHGLSWRLGAEAFRLKAATSLEKVLSKRGRRRLPTGRGSLSGRSYGASGKALGTEGLKTASTKAASSGCTSSVGPYGGGQQKLCEGLTGGN